MNRWATLVGLILLCVPTSYAQRLPDYWNGDQNFPCTNPRTNPNQMATTFNTTRNGAGTTSTLNVVSTATILSGKEYGYIEGALDSSFNVPRTGFATPVLLTVLNATQISYPNPGAISGSTTGAVLIPANDYVQLQTNGSWYNCDPAGNELFLIGNDSANMVSGGSLLASKYGNNTTTAGKSQIAEFLAWGGTVWVNPLFTSFFRPDGSPPNQTCGGACQNLMMIKGTSIDSYATANLNNHAAQPIIEVINGVNDPKYSTISSDGPFGCMDTFDPYYEPFIASWILTDPSQSATTAPSWVVGLNLGAAEFGVCSGAGPDFDTFPTGHQSTAPGLIHWIASPLQTYNSQTIRGPAVYYPDPLNYTKVPMASPPGSCNGLLASNLPTSGPCTFATYLVGSVGVYANIGALNTAWTTSYTTAGSSGTGVGYNYSWLASGSSSPEILCTGTGSSSTCNHTLSTLAVSPYSVQLSIKPHGGVTEVVFTGDCPKFSGSRPSAHGNCGGSVGTGQFKNPANFANGTSYPINQVITDSNGDLEEVTTPGTTQNSGTPAWPVTTSCTGTQTTVSGSVTFTCMGVGLASGACSIVYSTGVITCSLNNNLANLATISARYVANGWSIGTGLLDEDGRNLVAGKGGTNGSFLKTVDPSLLPGTDSYAARSGGPTPVTVNANQNLANDLLNWGTQYYNQMFFTLRSGLKAGMPYTLYMSPDTTGNWASPPFKQTLIAMNPYVDIGYMYQWWSNFPSLAVGAAQLQYTTTYFKGAMLNQSYFSACMDSPVAAGSGQTPTCRNVAPLPTHGAMGNQVYTTVHNMLTTRDANGHIPWVGHTTWSLNDCDTDQGGSPPTTTNAWGIKDCGIAALPAGVNSAVNNGRYNGIDNAHGAVNCAAPSNTLPCGNEPLLPATGASWAPGANYTVNGVAIQPSPANGFSYTPFSAGTGGSVQPNFASCVTNGCTIADGSAVLMLANPQPPYGDLIGNGVNDQKLAQAYFCWFTPSCVGVAPPVPPPAPCIAQCFTFNVPAGSLHTDPNVCPVHCGVVTYCGAGDGYWVYDATCKWSKFPTGSIPTTATITIPAQPAQTITGKVQ